MKTPQTFARRLAVSWVAGGLGAFAASTACALDDHGDVSATASLLSLGSPLVGRINGASDKDLFRLDFPGQATVELRTSGQTDTRGELLDSTGARLVSDDNSGPGDNFQLAADLEPGIYYVQVDGAPGAYAVSARVGNRPDHGDTVAASTLLKLHSGDELAAVRPAVLLATAGRIYPSTDDVDMFRLDVPQPAHLTVRTSGEVDTYAALMDSAENQIAFDDSDGDFRIEAPVDAGIYYLRIHGHGIGAYRVLAAASSDVAVRNDGTDPDTPAVVGNVVVNEDGPDGVARWGSDPYELQSAEIEADTLLATVSYGGGCANHAFTLVLENAFKMTDPPRLPATLAHDADDDMCEAWLTEDYAFDLTPLKRLAQDDDASGTVILELTLADGTQRDLHYRF